MLSYSTRGTFQLELQMQWGPLVVDEPWPPNGCPTSMRQKPQSHKTTPSTPSSHFDSRRRIPSITSTPQSCKQKNLINILQVEPGKPGAEVSKKKNYKSKKEFAYRMCARRPTSAMPKPFLCCEPAFCCSMVVM